MQRSQKFTVLCILYFLHSLLSVTVRCGGTQNPPIPVTGECVRPRSDRLLKVMSGRQIDQVTGLHFYKELPLKRTHTHKKKALFDINSFTGVG